MVTTLSGLQREIPIQPLSAKHLDAKALMGRLFKSLGEIARVITSGFDSTAKEKTVLQLFLQYLDLCSYLKSRNVHELLWEKYPEVCPYCCEERDQDCSPAASINEEMLEQCRRQRNPPRSVRGWQKMFQRIYGQRNQRRGLFFICLRLFGEVTELFDLFDQPEPKDKDIDYELADIGAWVFALSTMLEVDLQAELNA